MNDTLSSILQATIPPLLTALGAWFLARKKYNAETSASELDNVEKSLAIYREVISDLRARVKELEEQVERLEKKLIEYKQNLKS